MSRQHSKKKYIHKAIKGIVTGEMKFAFKAVLGSFILISIGKAIVYQMWKFPTEAMFNTLWISLVVGIGAGGIRALVLICYSLNIIPDIFEEERNKAHEKVINSSEERRP